MPTQPLIKIDRMKDGTAVATLQKECCDMLENITKKHKQKNTAEALLSMLQEANKNN